MAFPLPDKPSIAVLAFSNMSGDPKDSLFGDGLAEGIINGLSKSDRVFVIARNSSFTYKGKPVKVKQVAEEMGVRYVIEGSVQREGERVRITVQLIDALTGHHLFSERYDRDLKGILSLQDEITMKVLTAVRVKLTSGELARIHGKGTKNLDAYLKVLEATEHKGGAMNKERVQRAMQLLDEAIALDPEYPSAYSILSTAHFDLVALGASDSPKDSLRRAVELGNKAIALDDSHAAAHANLAFPYVYLREFDKAIEEAEKGVSLSPNSALGYWALGTALYSAGRSQEAIPFVQKSLRLSPIPIHSQVLGVLAGAYAALGQYEEAITTYKKLLQIYGPDHLLAHLGLAATYVQMGRENEARAESAEVLRIDPKFSWERWIRGLPFDQSRKERLAGALRKAGLSDKPPLPLPDKPSIAVLPFVNMSDDKSQEFFSDGLTEEIITALSKTPKLFVIARNSSFVYKGKPVNVQQVSRELGVKYVLEGSVRSSGDQLRITAQLIDATTGNHLWAERYDREMKDIFAIQDEVTMKILTSLQVTLTEGEAAHSLATGTKNLEAYLKTMEARELLYRLNKDDAALSIKRCEEAIALDPRYSGAFAVLSSAYSIQFGFGINPRESLTKAYEYAQKAISHDEAQTTAYRALEFLYGWRKEHEKAVEAAEQAIKTAPGSADAYLSLGRALNSSCRDEEAKVFLEKAIRINPYPPSHYYMHLGCAQFHLRQHEQAETSLRKALAISPRNHPARLGLIATYIEMNKLEEAKSEAEELLKIDPKYTSKGYEKRAPWKDPKVMERWVEALRKAGLERDVAMK
jgi:TolB-like protein/Tfp pilus assembly protein PilF